MCCWRDSNPQVLSFFCHRPPRSCHFAEAKLTEILSGHWAEGYKVILTSSLLALLLPENDKKKKKHCIIPTENTNYGQNHSSHFEGPKAWLNIHFLANGLLTKKSKFFYAGE